MTDLRKAAEMALEALELERTDTNGNKVDLVIPAIEALRQALAQDKQEPVIDRRLKVKIGRQYGYALNEHWFYLQPADEYAEQALTKHSGISVPPKREWVGLTNKEVDAIRNNIFEKYKKALFVTRDVTSENDYSAFNFYRAIEEKLRIKND